MERLSSEKVNLRRVMLGGGTALGVLIVLALLGAIHYIILQHPKRWDVTRASQFTLAPQSRKVLDEFRGKNEAITILAFFGTKDAAQRERAADLLEQYREAFKNLTYTFVDPDRNRASALQNKIDTYPTLVLKARNKDERITTASEENITNALMKLLRDEKKKIYFLTGHGEVSVMSREKEGFSDAKEQLQKQNFDTDELVLLNTPNVPDDATALVIAGPQTELLEPELVSIRTFIQRGGAVFVLLVPFKTPQLVESLKSYGVESSNDIIIDKASRVYGGDYLIPVITTYINSPITKDFRFASFFPLTRPVRASKTAGPEVKPEELALTSELSWTISEEQLKSGDATFVESKGTKGPLPVMAASTVTTLPAGERKHEGEDKPHPKKARIVVTGSAQFASNQMLQAVQGNRELFLNSIAWLTGDENLISIRPKTTKADPLMLNNEQARLIFIIPVVMIPAIWLMIGISVYLVRKRSSLPT